MFILSRQVKCVCGVSILKKKSHVSVFASFVFVLFQASVMKLNLCVVEILASFPAVVTDAPGQVSNGRTWQADIVAYMMDQIDQCAGTDLGKNVTAILQKMFFNFHPSSKN